MKLRRFEFTFSFSVGFFHSQLLSHPVKIPTSKRGSNCEAVREVVCEAVFEAVCEAVCEAARAS